MQTLLKDLTLNVETIEAIEATVPSIRSPV
jgi:hypothetical protein